MKVNKMLRSLLLVLLCVASVVTITSCDDNNEDTKVLKLNPSSLAVAPTLTSSVAVSGGTAPYTVKSSDDKIATVTVSGNTLTVTGQKEGVTTVLVTDKNKLTGSLPVRVSKDAVPLTFDNASLSLNAGKSGAVTVKSGTSPYTASTANAKVATATVKDNVVTIKAVKAGKTTITVTDKKQAIGTITVTVK